MTYLSPNQRQIESTRYRLDRYLGFTYHARTSFTALPGATEFERLKVTVVGPFAKAVTYEATIRVCNGEIKISPRVGQAPCATFPLASRGRGVYQAKKILEYIQRINLPVGQEKPESPKTASATRSEKSKQVARFRRIARETGTAEKVSFQGLQTDGTVSSLTLQGPFTSADTRKLLALVASFKNS